MNLQAECEKALVEGLRPFLENALRNKFGASWFEKVNATRTGQFDRKITNNYRWDVPDLLRTMDQFFYLLESKFSSNPQNTGVKVSELRSEIKILRELRHRHAHQPRTPFDQNDGERFVSLAAHLLRAAGADREATSVEDLMQNRKKLSVKRIVDRSDPDLFRIWQLQVEEFSDEIADKYEDMQGWVSDIEINFSRENDHQFDDIMLALKFGIDVVGYLYAQFYPQREVIFISYLGYDPLVREAVVEGPKALLRALFDTCNSRSAIRWSSIVAEVEQVKENHQNHSRVLFTTFNRYAAILDDSETNNGKLFLVDFDYLQPFVKPEDINAGISQNQSLKQKILYYCRDINTLSRDDNGSFKMTKEQSTKLLNDVISCVYGDAFPDNVEYTEYLKYVLASYRPKLSSGLRLLSR